MINNFVVFLEGATSDENEAIRQRVIDIKFTKGRSRLSGIFIGFGNIICDNSDGFFDSFSFSPYRKIEIATYHQYTTGSPPTPFRYYIIRGYEKAFKKNEEDKTIEFVFEDRLTFLNKKKCPNKTYKNETVYNVIRELVHNATGLYPFVYTDSETIPFLSLNDTMTIQEALTLVLDATGGFIIAEETEIKAYTGFSSTITPTVVNIAENDILGFQVIEKEGAFYDKSILKSSEYVFKSNEEKIYEGVRSESLIVPAAGLGVTEDYYLELDDPIHYLADYSTVEFEADSGLTFDSTTYNSNLQTSNVPVNANRVKIKVTNSTGATKEIKKLNLFGKKFYTKKYDAIYQPGSSDANELVFENEIVQEKTQAGKIAALNLARENFEETYVIQTELFKIDSSNPAFWQTIILENIFRSYAFKIGAYNFSSANNNLLTPFEITFDFVNNVLEVKFRKSHFLYHNYSSSNVSFKEYLENAKLYLTGDGLTPEAPSSLSLTTEQPSGEYKSVVNVSFTASTSPDIEYYNIEYKTPSQSWANANVVQTKVPSKTIEVESNTYYDIRISAIDYDGLESAYLLGNIVSAKITGDGSVPPRYVFDSSECEVVVINNKRYAHLYYYCLDAASDDIKSVKLRWRKTDDDFSYGVDYNNQSVVLTAPVQNVMELSFEDSDVYIEIERAKYTFGLLVEDFDNNMRVYHTFSASDTSIQYIDATSSYIFSSSTPSAPTVSTLTYNSGYTLLAFSLTTPNFDYIKAIEFQIEKDAVKDSSATYRVAADMTIIAKSTNYKLYKSFPAGMNVGETYKARARVVSLDDVNSAWSTTLTLTL